MVAQNPLFRGRWTIKKFNATVINDIWPEVLFFTLIATMVYLVSELTPHSLSVPNTLLTVLGTVLGLVISFRTSSAYERYQDGRKMWTNIAIASRNLAQLIWIHVPFDRPAKNDKPAPTILQTTIEKKTIVNLVQAFSVAVKHYLRGEVGVYYRDLYPLVCFLPRYATAIPGEHSNDDLLPMWHASEDDEHVQHPHDMSNVHASHGPPHGHEMGRTVSLPDADHAPAFSEDNKSEKSWFNSLARKRDSPARSRKFDPEQALPIVNSHRPLKPARNPPETSLYDYFPIFKIFKWIFRKIACRPAPTPIGTGARTLLGHKRRPEAVESNVPLEVMLFLSSYSASVMSKGLVQPAIATGLMNNLTSLQDTMSNLERIRNTPLPFAYQAHLRMSLWLYLFFLPFQILSTFKYLTIPGTAFASFLLLGFLEIGQEIENPFNYDLNDLDLDDFCLQIQRELHEITAHSSPDVESYIFNSWNQPFAPADRRTAEELTKNGATEYHPEGGAHSHSEEATVASLRRTLLRGWKDVDDLTRHT